MNHKLQLSPTYDTIPFLLGFSEEKLLVLKLLMVCCAVVVDKPSKWVNNTSDPTPTEKGQPLVLVNRIGVGNFVIITMRLVHCTALQSAYAALNS